MEAGSGINCPSESDADEQLSGKLEPGGTAPGGGESTSPG